MASGRLWRLIVLAIGVLLASAVMVSGEIATFHQCHKVSDTELRVDLICQHFDGYYYQYYFSDGTTTNRIYNGYTIQHTFSDVTVESFPLSIYVTLYLTEQTSELSDSALVVIECSDLFAPEISVAANGATIPDGGTHTVVGEQVPGPLQLAFTIDNTAGAGDLIVDGVAAASLTNCGGFTVHTALPLTVEDGETGSLRVSVTLDDPGAFGFALDISSNDPDQSSYGFDVSGQVMTAEQVALGGATRQLVPMGQGGDGMFLDCAPVLDAAGNPVMAGYLPLGGVYEVGETVGGAAMVCDAAGTALRSAWIYAHAYAVDLGTRPPSSELLESWMIRFDPEPGGYPLSWDTEGLAPGIYDIYLSIGSGGAGQTIRIRLDEP